MYKNFRFKLFFVLLLLAIVIAFSILLIDYFRMRESIQNTVEIQIEHATEKTVNALRTIDKVLTLLDHDITPKMSLNTKALMDEYRDNPDVASWDYDALSEQISMDIYIINDDYVVEYSNIPEEIGLDFKECCETLHKKLEARRMSGSFYIDHIDIDQKNGELKKFSYMATPDKKYIIELGYNLKDDTIFHHFNFVNVANEIIEDSNFIKDINVLNFGGMIYGEKDGITVTGERKNSFEKALETLEVVEHRSVYSGEEVVYRYIPYVSSYDDGATKLKVVEIMYSEKEFTSTFRGNFRIFFIQFIFIIIVTVIASSLLATWLSKPIHYAFHDSLTGLKNRAAFNELLKDNLDSKGEMLALLILDLDNFKLVNDHLGHHEGDRLLQNIANKLKQVAEINGNVFRLGGDEFAIILQNTSKDEVETIANMILEQMSEVVSDEKISRFAITVSIGVSLSKGIITKEELFLQADKALYASKRKGKNQFQIYDKSMGEVVSRRSKSDTIT